MKFGKKRSPEPEPIDITARLAILDLRPSVREGITTPVSAGIATPQTVPVAVPEPLPVAVPEPASVTMQDDAVDEVPELSVIDSVEQEPGGMSAQPVQDQEPVEPLGESEPVADEEPLAGIDEAQDVEPAAAEPRAEPAAPTTTFDAPDPLAYEMAAFELNLPPAAPAQPVPSEPANVAPSTHDDEPAAVHHDDEPEQTEPVQSGPAEAEQHDQHEDHLVAAIGEPIAAPQPPAWSYEQVARIEHAEQHVSAWVPAQAATTSEHVVVDEPVTIDLTEPSPEVDLTEATPVYAVVEPTPAPQDEAPAQNQSRDDDGVIRWHW